MVQLINEKGKIRLESEISLADECNSFEAIISNPEYKERIKAAEKDCHLSHRIENKDGNLVSIAQRSLGKIVKAGEFSDLAQSHIKFLDFLSSIDDEEIAKRTSIENPGEHDPSDEEVFKALSEFLRNTFGVVVIGVVK
jgi:hypothetical protein